MTGECDPFEEAMRLLGSRWAGAVIRAMGEVGTVAVDVDVDVDDGAGGGDGAGFVQIRDRIPGITDATLTARLRQLCAAGIATRRVEPGPPVRITYALTDAGRDALGVLAAVERFALRHHTLFSSTVSSAQARSRA